MSKKSFKIARKPGQGNNAQAVTAPESARGQRPRKTSPAVGATVAVSAGLTTRKTIEVPEDYFRRVKLRAVERGMLEKELWSEILTEYFEGHPMA